MKSESKIMNEIRLALSPRTKLFRQQVGQFFTHDGRPIYVGMKGTPDLIGYTTVEITQAMVGHLFARYTVIECKAEKGRVSPAQKMFLDAVKNNGGIAGVARSVEEAMDITK